MLDKKNIETIYPLAPLQQMFLWHGLQASVKAGLLHIRCHLQGDLDAEQLKRAWELVIAQHPALRTSVHWENVKQPLQVVARQVSLPWQCLDWSDHGREPEDLQQRLEHWLIEDRDRSFDLSQSPILRITLIRLATQDYELVWSCHHLMLDGWSGALIINQVLEIYGLLRQEKLPSLRPAPTYQKYIQWLNQQDEAAATQFWQENLRGFEQPTSLPVGSSLSPEALASQPANTEPPPTFSLSADEYDELKNALRLQRLTLNSLIQGVWAILLQSYNCNPDVLFGMTVSGRQGDLVDVERIVGLLINVLPVRLKTRPGQKFLEFLREIQGQQAELNRFAYASPTQIQACSGQTERLFNSLLVIENYLIQGTSHEESLQLSNLQSGIVSDYDITVIVKPQDDLQIELCALDSSTLSSNLRILLEQFQVVLKTFISHPEESIDFICQQLKRDFSFSHPPLLLSQESSQLMAVEVPKNSASINHLELQLTDSNKSFLSPLNNLELQLIAIWEQVLNTPSIGLDDNFFDLGGNSLLAAQLFAKIEDSFSRSLPLALLFQAPTIRQLARMLDQSGWSPSWSSLVPIQPLGSKKPLFFVHPAGGNVLYYRGISNYLGTEQPFYGLQSQGLDGQSPPHTTVEEMATHYIQEIKTVQPQGPYYLGGFCLGGTVAFEMAQQLQRQDQQVKLLALMDPSYSLSAIGMHPPIPKSSGKDLQYYLQFLIYLRKVEQIQSFIFKKLLRSMNHLKQKISSGQIFSQAMSPSPSQNEQFFETVLAANEQALETYLPSFYPGCVTYLQSTDYSTSPIFTIVQQKYRECCSEVDYVLVPTFHHPTVLDETHIMSWSDSLKTCLEAAQETLD